MGPFTLYEPAKLLRLKMPWYKRTRYNTVSDVMPNVGEGTLLRAVPIAVTAGLSLPSTSNEQ